MSECDWCKVDAEPVVIVSYWEDGDSVDRLTFHTMRCLARWADYSADVLGEAVNDED